MKIFLLLLLCSPLAVLSQSITGTVTDSSSGEALPGANVFYKNNPSTGTTTNPEGRFSLDAQASDILVFRFVGFSEFQLIVTNQSDYSIKLTPDQKEMKEVVIKAERLIAEEFIQKKINKLEIYTNPSAKADPILAVNSTPAATTLDESANISLRGSVPAETGIFLNNVPVNDAVRYSQLNGIGTFSIFNTALIKDLSVFPGNPPLEFGNTTAGLISLQTDEVIPEKPVNTVSITLASMGFYTQRRVGEKSSLTAFSNYQPSNFIKALNGEALKQLKKFNSIDAGVHYFLKPTDRTTFKVFNYSLQESYQFHFNQPTVTEIFHQKKFRNFTIANYRVRTRKGEWSFNNGLSFSKGSYTYSTIDLNVAMNDFYSSINYQHFFDKAELKSGISYDYKGNDFKGSFPEFDYAIGNAYPALTSEEQQSITVPEIYVYGKYYLTPNVILGGGLRQLVLSSASHSYLSRQLNVNYRPSQNISFILATGQYNKLQLPQSSGAEAFLITSNQHSLDLNYNNKKFESSLSLFYKNSHQLNQSATVKGLEIYGKYQLTRNIKTQLSITSLDATNTKDNIRSPSPYDIGYFLRGNVEYKFLGTWTTTMVFLFREGSFYLPVEFVTLIPSLNVYKPTYGQDSRLPSYNSIDLSISKLLLIRSQFVAVAFLGLNNVGDFKNVRDYSYNFDYSSKEASLFSRRTIYFGLIINF